ncbi:hypothetical protein LVQ78_23835 [Buttiauxella sp. A2-C2_NF]|uniref:hypothetical protein n=1 Tax=Buttiauxella ferragutiae TaxID=82989 RepID=UPI001E319A69|nr:hypothetical protein [Buttiauxella ferragutiae]MCE0829017.1 hypothetical protein [Buttiauxella ferragutiae]UNK63041.1 hypothetical protein MNO13_09015 [Buttiauxella ferragutiae]UNK63220.1 hypothetical protein MNO13_10100 [Buttiauxella ferragutiae]
MKCISVPISADAMKRLDFDECVNGDLIEVLLSEEEYNSLWNTGVINKINSALHINIDDYEDEELLGSTNLLQAKGIIESELSSCMNEILEKLLLQVNKAIEYNTGVFFYF